MVQTNEPDHVNAQPTPEATSGASASPPAQAASAPEAVSGSVSAEELQRRACELEDRLLRAKADFANLQRSARHERELAIRYANADLIRSLLTVFDDFDRALTIDARSEDAIRLRDGVRLVHENMLKALRERGVEIIDPLHQAFDPMFHEALLRQPSAEHAEGTVLSVLTKGYRMHERVLRPARVIVAAPPPTAVASPQAQTTDA